MGLAQMAAGTRHSRDDRITPQQRLRGTGSPLSQAKFKEKPSRDARDAEWLVTQIKREQEKWAKAKERWSRFLRQPAKVDSTMQRTIHHEDAETVFG